jgi:hypothetical protein
MNRIFTVVLVAAVCLGTTVLVANRTQIPGRDESSDAILAVDGAFRDGIYLGRLTAESGQASHPITGRWSTDKDRASFTAGYNRGYNDFLASAAAKEKSTRPE